MLTSVDSTIRQVPDNQEVFVEQNGFTSITFDVLEYVDKPDLEALEYHLKDIVEDDADKTRIISKATAHLDKLPWVSISVESMAR